LYALAPEFIRRGMEIIEKYGLIILLIIVVLGSYVLGNFLISADKFFIEMFQHIFGIA
jgi:hypothetical protein